jgi:hypothetical protein
MVVRSASKVVSLLINTDNHYAYKIKLFNLIAVVKTLVNVMSAKSVTITHTLPCESSLLVRVFFIMLLTVKDIMNLLVCKRPYVRVYLTKGLSLYEVVVCSKIWCMVLIDLNTITHCLRNSITRLCTLIPPSSWLYYYGLLKVFNAETLRTLLSSLNDPFDSILLNVQVLANLVVWYALLKPVGNSRMTLLRRDLTASHHANMK